MTAAIDSSKSKYMDIPATRELGVGETYRLTLPGLATAGYQWTYEITQSDDSVAAVTPYYRKRVARSLLNPRSVSAKTNRLSFGHLDREQRRFG